MDLYNRERRLSSAEQIVRISHISAQDKELIFKFETHLFAQNLKPLRVEKYIRVLRISAEAFNKPFKNVTKDEIDFFFARLNRSEKGGWTKRDYYLFLRRFYTWLGKESLFTADRLPRGNSRIPNLLSEHDVDIFVKRTPHPRDKAMIAGYYDAGCRVGEWFENLHVGDFMFEDDITEELVEIEKDLFQKKRIKSRVCTVNLFGKTGARSVRLNGSADYIEEWLKIHPKKNKPQADMWVDDDGNALFSDYDSVRSHVLGLLQKAGITKRIRLGAFRHSEMTAMDDKLRETYLKKRHGTSQLKTYIHSGANHNY